MTVTLLSFGSLIPSLILQNHLLYQVTITVPLHYSTTALQEVLSRPHMINHKSLKIQTSSHQPT